MTLHNSRGGKLPSPFPYRIKPPIRLNCSSQTTSSTILTILLTRQGEVDKGVLQEYLGAQTAEVTAIVLAISQEQQQEFKLALREHFETLKDSLFAMQ